MYWCRDDPFSETSVETVDKRKVERGLTVGKDGKEKGKEKFTLVSIEPGRLRVT